MVAGLYYDLQVDYANHLWNEFGKNIANTNVVNGVSYALYWSLISEVCLQKEGIFVPVDDPKVDFVFYQHPMTVEDDSEVFPVVARIPYAMLLKGDLISYLQTINPSIETGVLLEKGVTGPSKITKGSKKVTHARSSKPDPSPKKVVNPIFVPTLTTITKPVTDETSQPAKEIMPLMSGVLKQLKRVARRPCHSPERSIVTQRSVSLKEDSQTSSQQKGSCDSRDSFPCVSDF